MKNESIKVAARFRPLSKGEFCLKLKENTVTTPDATFTFDKVFSPNSTQKDIYDYAAENMVNDIMQGYNGTIFAYGQSGSGKTFSMVSDFN
jgi:kinesin family protein 5